MATLAKSAVTPYPATLGAGSFDFFEGHGNTVANRSLKLVLTGQGGATNTITADALGFSKLISATPLWDAEHSKGYPAVIDPVNNILILLDGSAAPAPVDVTASAAYIRVIGTPKNARTS